MGGSQGAYKEKRQRSLRTVFDHSWNQLTEREREVLCGLAVFRGGFSRQAARHVTGASSRDLMALVHSLLLQHTSTGRYEIDKSLRGYAAEKLDRVPAARQAAHDQHCAFFSKALLQWGEDLKGPRQQAALAEMDVEIENARAAWNWAVEFRQVERLNQAIDGLCRYHEWRVLYQDGEAACRKASQELAVTESGEILPPGNELRVLTKALAWEGCFNICLDRREHASEQLQRSLALLEGPELADQDTRPEKAFVLRKMGHVASVNEAEQLYGRSLALYQALGDRWETANTLEYLGWLAWLSAAYGKAKQLHAESLEIRQALGDRRGTAMSLAALGRTATSMGQLEGVERLLRESMAIFHELGIQTGDEYVHAVAPLGDLLGGVGQFAEAQSLLEESVAIYSDSRWRRQLALTYIELGIVKAHLGEYEEARAQGQMALTLARELDLQGPTGLSLFVLGCVSLAEEAYAEAHKLLQEAHELFLKESLDSVREGGKHFDLSWSLVVLSTAARGLGSVSEAQQYLCEALRMMEATDLLRIAHPTITSLAVPLPAAALLLADQGENERALELHALASRDPYVANSRWFEDIAGRHIAAIAATLPPHVVAAALERGRERDLEATVAELLAEFEC